MSHKSLGDMPDAGCMFDSGLRWDPSAAGWRVPWQRELHVVIVWNSGLSKVPAVRSGLEASGLEIVSETMVRWSPDLVAYNFLRLYATVPRKAIKKADHVGWGEFWLAVVEDHDPAYRYLPTYSGIMRPINARIHATKARLRAELSLGSALHSSNSAAEFLHDGALLFGRDGMLDIFAGHHPPNRMETDLAGASGWKTLEELAGVLELATPYVLLRSFDWIASGDLPKAPADLDVLTTRRMDFVHAAGGRRHNRQKSWPMFTIRIGGEALRIDVHEIADGYLDGRWAERLLRTSVSGPRGFKTPPIDEHFFSLAHHVLVDKPATKHEHRRKLSELSVILGPSLLSDDSQVSKEEFERSLASALAAFMAARGFTVPASRHPGATVHTARAAEFLPQKIMPVLHQDASSVPLQRFRGPFWAGLVARLRRGSEGRLKRVLQIMLNLLSAFRAEGLANVRPCWRLVTYSGAPGENGITRRVIATADLVPSAAYVRHWDGWERLVVPLSLTPHARHLLAFCDGNSDAGPYLFYKAMQHSIDEGEAVQHLRRFEDTTRRVQQDGTLSSHPRPLIAIDGLRSPRVRIVDGAHRLAIALVLFKDQTQRVELVE